MCSARCPAFDTAWHRDFRPRWKKPQVWFALAPLQENFSLLMSDAQYPAALWFLCLIIFNLIYTHFGGRTSLKGASHKKPTWFYDDGNAPISFLSFLALTILILPSSLQNSLYTFHSVTEWLWTDFNLICLS